MTPDEAAPSQKISVAAPRRLRRVGAKRPAPAPPAVAADFTIKEEAPIAAPARAKRLRAKPVLTDAERQAAKARERAAAVDGRSALERRLDGLKDPGEMLRVMEAQLTLQRHQRQHGNGRQWLRVLSIAALFALFVAGLGALFWLQNQMTTGGVRHQHHRVIHP